MSEFHPYWPEKDEHPPPRHPQGPELRVPRGVKILLIVLALMWLGQRALVEVLVDWSWFEAIGHPDFFTTTLGARVATWGCGFLLSLLFLGWNIRHATREAPIQAARLRLLVPELRMEPEHLLRAIHWGIAGLVVVGSLLFAQLAAQGWLTMLSWLHRLPFGHNDPIFDLDIGFYVFELPLLELLQQVLQGLIVAAMLLVGAFYAARDIFINRLHPQLSRPARLHLLVLGALFLITVAFGWWLKRYGLLYSQDGVVWGVGYADLHIRIPAAWLLLFTSLAGAAALLYSALGRGWRFPMGVAGSYLLLRFLAWSVAPGVVQSYYVKPNELGLEREFLANNIQASREAFALDRIDVRPYEAAAGLTMADVEANPLTIRNIRIWDDRPLLTTYGQIQEIRLYYDFHDVDVDRYLVDGQPRQVMLAARELNYSKLPTQAQSWVNEHFQYTHGYGLTMSPVNLVTQEGLPELYIKDLPPVSSVGIPTDRPEIYYGELTDRYVFVNTGADEFDYAMGDENVYATYQGQGGVPLGSLARKTLFSLYFRSLDILLSSYIEPQSRVMFHREIEERVRRLAPFLVYDHDPYLVVADGRMFWMLDAYTLTERYPYSEAMRLGRNRGNYMRNSVKVVVDAYNGSVDFYIADMEDPLIQVYASIFPNGFQPMSAMPAALAAHVRYPVDFFNVQATMYRAYHMIDPTVFYNKEDMWDVPSELYSGKEQLMEAYYLIMRLPDSQQGDEPTAATAEFILLLPFVPTNRDNMISWMAARCDPAEYGRLILYQFPKQKLIYGPRQIEARIDQDPEISELITLWSQAGSRVVRGNLLVIPIGNSLMYVEPLYLQAESSQLPELKRVIVSYENRISMRSTLQEALEASFPDALRAQSATASPTSHDQPVFATPTYWQTAAQEANQHFQQALERQQAGDWAGYGKALEALARSLSHLEALAGEAPADDAPDTEDTPPALPAAGPAEQEQPADVKTRATRPASPPAPAGPTRDRQGRAETQW